MFYLMLFVDCYIYSSFDVGNTAYNVIVCS